MANVSAEIGHLQAAQGVGSPADLNATTIDDLTPLCELVFVAGTRPCLIYLSRMGSCHVLVTDHKGKVMFSDLLHGDPLVGRSPSRQNPSPPARYWHLVAVTAVVSMHPTWMHSCPYRSTRRVVLHHPITQMVHGIGPSSGSKWGRQGGHTPLLWCCKN